MPYKLETSQIRELVTQPETGMGYQYVEATFRNYSKLKGVVLNSEIFVPEVNVKKIMGIYHLTYSKILQEAENPGHIVKLELITKNQLHLGENKYHIESKTLSASEANISFTEKNNVFKRFSPYRNDRRVTEMGSLLPGAYATTEEDANSHVSTGADATNRYALPSDDPAIYVFTIQPPEKTHVRRGIVQPANGKDGGGVEVLFENGTPNNTVTGPKTIPSK